MKRLENKKALVTGSSRGIGKAVALCLAAEGAEVVVHYHNNREEGEAVLGEIRANGGKAHLLQADLADAQQAINLGEEAWSAAGGLHFLVNNAGISYKKHFLDFTQEDVAQFTDTNFRGALFLTQTVAKKMVRSKTAGSICTVTSINGIQPGVGLSVYGATKGALETLMKGVALELAPHNITVNTVAAGAVETDMTAGLRANAASLKAVNDNIPMGRMGRPEEIAEVVCSLLAFGTYVTGATIVADGGWLLKNGFTNPTRYGEP